MYFSKFLIRPCYRFSFIFFISLAFLCTYVSDANATDDYSAEIKQAQAFSHVLEHAAESTLPSVVQIMISRGNSPSTENKVKDSPGMMQYYPTQLGTGIIIDFSPSTKTAVVLTTCSTVQDASVVTVELSEGYRHCFILLQPE